MSTITAAMVKELRDRTGAGMMDCKQALTENGGDMDQSIDWLRKKGLSKAAKKSGRVAAEGLIGVTVKGATGAAVEVNSETDFVARNASFQDMVRKVTTLAPDAGGNVDKLLAMTYPGAALTVDAFVKEQIATIGENLGVRRTAVLKVGQGVIADYLHNRIADGCGKIGVLVALESSGDKAKLLELGRQVAMHIAASNPMVVNLDELPKDAIERERAIYVDQARQDPKNAGKSDDILGKMSEGRLRKEFFQNVVLMLQTWVLDGKSTVEQAVKEAEKGIGAPIKISGFVRYGLGEGIEKKEEDFAAEVAKAVQGG